MVLKLGSKWRLTHTTTCQASWGVSKFGRQLERFHLLKQVRGRSSILLGYAHLLAALFGHVFMLSRLCVEMPKLTPLLAWGATYQKTLS